MRVAVVGGGISGLVAAYRLRTALGPAPELVLVEASKRVGGMLHTGQLAGGPMELGAEAFVRRRPELPALLQELDLAQQLVLPTQRRPVIWADAHLHPLPAGTLMGIPADAQAVTGLVDAQTCAQITAEAQRRLPWSADRDLSVGALVADRYGEQVVRRSVDPLLGGVYAGRAQSIGVRVALPTLAAALDAGAGSLSAAVAQALPSPAPGPVFGGVRDGYQVLLDALLAAAKPQVCLGTAASALSRDGQGWRVAPVGGVDAVVVATPAPVTAELLASVAPDAARAASQIPVASTVVVALALPADTPLPDNSGVLVATGEHLRAKAFTLSRRKWAQLADRPQAVVRASFGRFGDEPVASSDAQLVAAAAEDLATVIGAPVAVEDAVVRRWHAGIPQYGPGHLDLVAAIEAGIDQLPRLVLAGGYLHGVGVPACVQVATAAAQRLCAQLA